MWDEQGTYQIKVKARDIYGAESGWSEQLSITMPKSREFNLIILIIEKLMGRSLFLERLLQPIYHQLLMSM